VSLKENVQNGFAAVGTFFSDVVQETRKSSWPGRQELTESTTVVIVSLLLLSFFVGFCDKILVVLLRVLLPAG
jgi:preprotein translocase subunit SecE